MALLALALSALGLAAGAASAQPIIGPGHEAAIAKLVAAPGPDGALGGGYAITSIGIEPAAIRVSIEGPSKGALLLLPLAGHAPETAAIARSASFALVWTGPPPAPAPVAELARLIVMRDDGRFWTEVDRAQLASGTQTHSAFGAGHFPRALWFLFAVAAAALFFVVPLAAPFVCPWQAPFSRPLPARSRLTDGASALSFFSLVALAAAVVLLAHARFGALLTFGAEEEHFFGVAAACAAGKVCPLAGQPMTFFNVRLGPLFFQLLTLCRLAGLGPAGVHWLMLILNGLAALLVAVCGNRLLGRPWGLVAGWVAGASPLFAYLSSTPTHASFAPLPLAGFVLALLSYAKERRDSSFVVAAVCFLAATQLHGITWPLGLALVAVSCFARPSPRALLVAAVAALLLEVPWLAYYLQAGLGDFRIIGYVSAWADGSTSRAALWVALDRVAVALAAAGAIALAIDGFGAAKKPAARALLLTGAVVATVALVGRAHWKPQYGVVYLPFVPLAAAAGLRALVATAGAVASGGAHRTRRLFFVPAAALVCGLALVAETRLFLQPPKVGPALVFGDQLAVVTELAGHGFRAADLERRVHGARWERSQLGVGYLGTLVTPSGPPPGPGIEAILVGDCPAEGSSFAVAQAVLPLVAGPARLVLHARRLAPEHVVLSDRFDGFLALPILEYDGGQYDRAVLAVLDPTLALDPRRAQFLEAWARPGAATLRVTTALATDETTDGDGDRFVVLAHDIALPARVRIGGVVAAHVSSSPSPSGAVVHERFLITAAERRQSPVPLQIEIEIDRRDARFPQLIDLYEEPATPCP